MADKPHSWHTIRDGAGYLSVGLQYNASTFVVSSVDLYGQFVSILVGTQLTQ
jgi:hypothetical protein